MLIVLKVFVSIATLLVYGFVPSLVSLKFTIKSKKSYSLKATSKVVYNNDESSVLQRARLRLAEAQGKIPVGSVSEFKDDLASLKDLLGNISKSRLRFLNIRSQ